MLRWGPESGPVVVMALPLLEEANRVRAFAVTICHALAERGVASALPDLPGQGESLTRMETLSSMLDLEEAFEQAVDKFWQQGRKTYSAAIRSGALLDGLVELHGRWHFAPQDGADVMRELTRTKQAQIGSTLRLGEYWYRDLAIADGTPDAQVEVAGNLLSVGFLTSLKTCLVFEADAGEHLRTVRVGSDSKPADHRVSGMPLWRRAEPGNDIVHAQTLADDIAQWVRACEGC